MKYLLPILPLLLGVALAKAQPTSGPSRDEVAQQALAGRNLTAAEVGELEGSIERNPDDLFTRTKLLGYYFGSRLKSAEAKQTGREHALWVIKNHPEAEIAGLPFCQIDAILDPDGYVQAKQLWLDQAKAKSNNAAVLGHAANFFLIHDKSLAEDLLKQAQRLEPNA